MAQFTYSAHTQDGKLRQGTITAENKAAAQQALIAKGLQPILVEAPKSGGLNMEIKLPGSDKVSSKDLVIFTRQFSTMVSAGVPMLRALTTLKNQSESPALRKVIDGVVNDVQGGGNLSDALAKHPKAFSQIYVNMVRAGEAGGILDQVLDRLAFQQEKDSAMKGKLKSAMIYPAVIGVVMLIAFFVLMTFIVPKIGNIIVQLSNGKSSSLPASTRALLAISDTMRKPLFILAVVILVPLAIYLFRRWKSTPRGRYTWHGILLKIPIVKVIITKTAIARFSRIFASLMSAGVPILQAIETTAGAIGNAVIEKELLDCAQAVQAGSQLSVEIEKSKHFPPIVAQMLAVGEETGQTDTVIIKVAEFYEEEVDAAVAGLSSVIEPVMIVVLGAGVGLIAISVYGPIISLSSTAGGGG